MKLWIYKKRSCDSLVLLLILVSASVGASLLLRNISQNSFDGLLIHVYLHRPIALHTFVLLG